MHYKRTIESAVTAMQLLDSVGYVFFPLAFFISLVDVGVSLGNRVVQTLKT